MSGKVQGKSANLNRSARGAKSVKKSFGRFTDFIPGRNLFVYSK